MKAWDLKGGEGAPNEDAAVRALREASCLGALNERYLQSREAEGRDGTGPGH
jgi:hypothetical protein